MGESYVKRYGLLAAVLAALLLTAGCSNKDDSTAAGSTDFPTRTLAAGPGTTSAPPPAGATVTGPSEVVLRLEGDDRTNFSGFCTSGARDSVLSGRVPKSYRFDLRGRDLACRIEKRSPDGSLRAILLAGGATRSIQQTESPNSTISISYSGG